MWAQCLIKQELIEKYRRNLHYYNGTNLRNLFAYLFVSDYKVIRFDCLVIIAWEMPLAGFIATVHSNMSMALEIVCVGVQFQKKRNVWTILQESEATLIITKHIKRPFCWWLLWANISDVGFSAMPSGTSFCFGYSSLGHTVFLLLLPHLIASFPDWFVPSRTLSHEISQRYPESLVCVCVRVNATCAMQSCKPVSPMEQFQ